MPTCELFSGPDLRTAQLCSPLFAFAFQQTSDHALVHAARHASRVTRDSSAIERGDWYLFAEGALLVIGHVAEIAELRVGARSLMRFWLDVCFKAPNEGAGGLMCVPMTRPSRRMLVRLEDVAVTPLLCTQGETAMQFRRIL